MTMTAYDRTRQKIAIMQAFAEGQAVQVYVLDRGASKWEDDPDPSWGWGRAKWRIKPQPRKFTLMERKDGPDCDRRFHEGWLHPGEIESHGYGETWQPVYLVQDVGEDSCGTTTG
jgi:hypothetical protein